MRVVIDTNVFLSAILYRGLPNRLVECWQAKKITLLISKEILEEFIQVLAYPKFAFSEQEIKDIIEKELLPFVSTVKIQKDYPVIVKEDLTDNKFLHAAVEGKALYIVSGDRHLLNIKRYQDITIVNVRNFLSILGITE